MEIKIERHRETVTYYQKYFEYAPHCGCGFPCDADGNVDLTDAHYPQWKENYENCINGLYPHLTSIGVRKRVHFWTEPAVGICDICGKDVILEGDRYGALQCECGQWYNVFGQQLNPPEQWEEPLEPEDYY